MAVEVGSGGGGYIERWSEDRYPENCRLCLEKAGAGNIAGKTKLFRRPGHRTVNL